MKGITLTKKSWHRKYYEFWWAKDAPNNLCNYFWGLLLALVTIPLIAGRAVYEFMKEYPQRSTILTKTFFYLVNTLVFVVGGGFALGYVLGNAFYYPTTSLAFIGAITLGLLAVTAFVATCVKIDDSEMLTMTSEAIKSKKNKVCPRIDWQ